MNPFSLNIKGRLVTYDTPVVMGILNVTPDSFYSGSRAFDDNTLFQRIKQLVSEGADIIDIGGYSTRPGSVDISEGEEIDRLARGMRILKEVSRDIIVSVDTFRANVALVAVKELGCDIVNDISGGNIDDSMLSVVTDLNVPYILTHGRGTPADMAEKTDYSDVTADVLTELGEKLRILALGGVNDVIVDPGIGFAKTTFQNYELIRNLEVFQVLHRPLLVGVSRKSLITKCLSVTPEEALPGTIALNALCLDRGAAILRVHDVKAARHCIDIYNAVSGINTNKNINFKTSDNA